MSFLAALTEAENTAFVCPLLLAEYESCIWGDMGGF
jgi:hypothetical protein